jgi:hypothetical protein
MNAHDRLVWSRGLAKLKQQQPLTDAEREVLLHFGGGEILPLPYYKACGTPRRTRTKARPPLLHADLNGKLWWFA